MSNKITLPIETEISFDDMGSQTIHAKYILKKFHKSILKKKEKEHNMAMVELMDKLIAKQDEVIELLKSKSKK